MDNVETPPTTPYDGCGRCLVGVRRLSRRNEASQSPEKQLEQVLAVVEANDAHVIAWADDWEVSGAMDPLKRPQLGPWLTGKRGAYDGIAGAAVDRIGRNVRDVLNTAYTIHERNQILLTADHDGIWDLNDPNQETDLLVKALGAQMEHRAILKRSNDSKTSARRRGRVSAKPAYGYEYFRAVPNGPVSETRLRPGPAREIRKVARRILADQTGTITSNFEFKRLNREGALSPSDELALIYGRDPKGTPWSENSLRRILLSKVALGYLIHEGEPVLDESGRPIKIAPELWDYSTHLALVEKLSPRAMKIVRPMGRANQGKALYAGRCFCGVCKYKVRASSQAGYQCTARHKGLAPNCKPSPSMKISMLDEEITAKFLAEYGHGQVMEKVYDPGTNYAAQIAEIEASRARLRQDRKNGMYEDADDYQWFVTEYKRMGDEIKRLKQLPERPAGVSLVPTGETVADQWKKAKSIPDRQEILAEFGVRVEIFPRGTTRLVMTAVDPYADMELPKAV
ncbi:recombinase family protein [Streptomyces cyaneofuscatus]|uniref:recombinase family protein n=1 Tax=Streptomyces cyaneofuscatus TaxID=66883 RepID=UPI00365E3704